METNKVIHGFRVLKGTPVTELEATLWEMEHEKTGARLVWLDRQEENKTFAIGFLTQPWDDTGVFHILEHSVLCGSDKFPVKEPFVELIKKSLNTFLNAFTFPDKTMYPVCSRNDQDFINLVRVYMDAVLHPMIHNKPEIFCQEGWHYELSEGGEASYKGVVFNEMKGAFASPDALLVYKLMQQLFPDNCYRWESGGHPEHIPELTYEQFAAAHKRLYHPSNSYIYLDGKMDAEKILGILDGEYLSGYSRIPTPPPIPMQKPVDGGTSEIVYELSPQEELKGRARVAEGYVACSFQDREEITALEALQDVLSGDNHAPLKRRLISEGLARDVRFVFGSGVLQPYVVIEARDVDEEKLDAASAALRDELEKLAGGALDRRRVLASLDNLEFQMRERDYGRMPQGLLMGLNVMETWLYGGDPAVNLSIGDLFDRLREKCGQGWFEELLRRTVLDNPHTCKIIMRPSHTVGRENQERERERLRAAQSHWSVEDAAKIREQQARIEAWQNTPDTPEALATIPMLRLDQIPAEPEKLPLEETSVSGIKCLRHELPAAGISYYNLYFALDDMSEDQLTKASFLCRLLGSLDTANYPLEDLKRETRSLFGALHFNVAAYGAFEDPSKYRVFLCVSASVLDSKAEKALPLLAEILTATKFNDPEKAFALLCQFRAKLSEMAAMGGDSFGKLRVSARLSATGVATEVSSGITYLRWLKDLEDNFQDRFPALADELSGLARTVFTRSRLTVSVTGASAGAMETAGSVLSHALPGGCFSLPEKPVLTPWEPKKEGIVLPVDVSFAVMAGPFPDASKGSAKVLAHAASYDFLWNAVRVQGGAYGVSMSMLNGGIAGFGSYRDPSARRSLDCYRQTVDYLMKQTDADLTGFIIGTIAYADTLLTPKNKGAVADRYYWQGYPYEALARQRKEMLSASGKDFPRLAEELRNAVDNSSICVLGSQKQVDECASELDEISVL